MAGRRMTEVDRILAGEDPDDIRRKMGSGGHDPVSINWCRKLAEKVRARDAVLAESTITIG